MDNALLANVIGGLIGLGGVFSWAFTRFSKQNERIAILETKQESLDGGINDLKDGMKELTQELKKHMADEPRAMQDALRIVLNERPEGLRRPH